MFGRTSRKILLAAILMTLPLAVAHGADNTLERMDGWPYAGARAVAVDAARDLVYLGSGGAVLVLDMSDPADPQLVSDSLHTDGHVRDLRYDGANQHLCVADWRTGLEIWDLEDPQNPERLSSVPVYYSGTDADFPTDGLVILGEYLYINANDARVHAFDISDAANPVDLGVQAGPFWYYIEDRDTDDVAASGGYLYVGGSGGLAKYLIHADGTLEKVGENLYSNLGCMEAKNPYVYAGVSGGLGVFDVSYSYPELVGSANVSEGLNDLALIGNNVVAVNRDGLLVFDVSTPPSPQQIASLALPDEGHRVRFDGDIAYVACEGAGLQVVDISDLYNPVLIGSYDTVGSTAAVMVAGDYAFLGQSTDGLVITDISNPNAVQTVGTSEGGSAIESLLLGDYLYVTDYYTPALHVFDVSDVSNPVEVGAVSDFTAVDLATDGEFLYATRFSVATQLYYLHVFDLSDPTSPVELSTIPMSPHILELDYANDHLFAIEFYDTGLHIINVSDPYNPFEDAFYPVDWGEDVCTQGNYAFVTSFHQGLLVLDISEPASPTLAGNFYEVFQFGDVAVTGDLAFITTGTTGEQYLRLYDVSDLGNINELDRMLLPGDAWDLTAQDGFAYVADGFAGLQVISAGADVPTIGAEFSCVPSSGTVPFSTQMTVTLANLYTGERRRIAGRIDITLAGGYSFPSWRTGYANVAAGGGYTTAWVTDIPAIGSVVGDNTFQLFVEDVTPSPFNQPPYPPAGDTANAACTVTGVAP